MRAMILCIDAGNSRVKWRLTDNGQQLAQGAQLTSEVADGKNIDFSDIKSLHEVRIASVAGEKIVEQLQQQLRQQFSVPVRLRRCLCNSGRIKLCL